MRIIWRRLLTAPAARVTSRDAGATRLRLDGLVCDDVCAVRARDAIASLPGVQAVDIDFAAGTATVTGAPHAPDEYDAAVRGAVVGTGLRRFIEHGLRRRPA